MKKKYLRKKLMKTIDLGNEVVLKFKKNITKEDEEKMRCIIEDFGLLQFGIVCKIKKVKKNRCLFVYKNYF